MVGKEIDVKDNSLFLKITLPKKYNAESAITIIRKKMKKTYIMITNIVNFLVQMQLMKLINFQYRWKSRKEVKKPLPEKPVLK